MAKSAAESVVKDMKARKTKSNKTEVTKPAVLIPSGSRRLDLACSDRIDGAFVPGRYVNLIGDSSAGKSFLALSMLAEMSVRPEFDSYRFIYDDAEEASSFDISYLFGEELNNRLEAPAYDDMNEPVHSDTIQDFNMYVFDAFESTKPFIYILDSFDSLTSKAEIETTDKNLAAQRKGTKVAGTYGMDKPKIIGQILRQITGKLKQTKSFILIISQTRDNINPMSFSKKTRSGGNALKFYASHEIWLASLKKLKKTINGQDRVTGGDVRAKVSKNKLTGKIREIEFSLYYEYGIDDIGSCIDFLVSTEYWGKTKNTIHATDLDKDAARPKLIEHIETNDLEETVYKATEVQWNAIEDALKLNRKSKFKKR